MKQSITANPSFAEKDLDPPLVQPASGPVHCFHCGTLCRNAGFTRADKAFCCQGCRTVFELLSENGLADFYNLSTAAGVRVKAPVRSDQYRFLDDPSVRGRLVDFSSARMTRVTFHLPAVHCIACVWLLENLFRLEPGLGSSRVNFPRKEVALMFDPAKVKLSEVAALLASLGYEPELKLSALDSRSRADGGRRLWQQLGLAGFAFGNIMLFSIPAYFGLDMFAGPGFQKMVGVISLLLALPVVTYSAMDYWRAARTSLQQRLLNIDVPIAAGIAVIFARSVYEVASGHGAGYFDSLTGLIFFLLAGRLFQQKTYARLAFDRDYKSFFPLAVTRLHQPPPIRRDAKTGSPGTGTGSRGAREEQISLAQLAIGDRLLIRNGELIPADSRLASGPALIDYSFVTGESEPVAKAPGDHLYAGGRQMGGGIEIETVKAVSQSYLTSLWNQDVFGKEKSACLQTLTNKYSQRFTKLVIGVAVGAAAYWAVTNPANVLNAFASVLIVACPCALALAAPFTLGTAQRVLARRNVYVKNGDVVEGLARVDLVVLDKTGTLTATGGGAVGFRGSRLSEREWTWLYSMTRHSVHPLSVRVGEAIAGEHFPEPVRSFLETPGCGMEGSVAGHEIWMGSAAWLESRGVKLGGAQCADGRTNWTGQPEDRMGRAAAMDGDAGSVVHVAIDGKHRGVFLLTSAVRAGTAELIGELAGGYEVALLSGDSERERQRFASLFGSGTRMHFNRSPLDKLNFIKGEQASGKRVLMMGDGLNDAGALQQSDVGVAVVEKVSAFAPASDVILAAGMAVRLGAVLRYARQSVRVVRLSFVISAVYNLVGVAIAASGKLSPVVCAILMPLSSITVVGFACAAATWLGRGLAEVRGGIPAAGGEGGWWPTMAGVRREAEVGS